MADVQSNIEVNIDTSSALASLKNLQRQLAIFNASFSKSSAAATRAQADFSNNLVNSINATGKFAAGVQTIQSATERFTDSLEKNKFSTREYFRYAAGSTKAFSKVFSTEFNTIQKVAEERVKDLQTQYIKMGRNANGSLKAISVRPLALDMEDLSTKVAITSQKQQIFGQLLKQGSTNLLNFGKNTQWAGRQLMVGFTIPLTIFGSKASQVFMDLEKQAIKFKRVYGEMFTSQGETQQALEDVKALAKEFTKYGVAVSDTISMAADAAAQGKTGADLMAQVTEATRLSVLGQVEQQQALQTTISLQNAFGYSAEQLASKVNFLNAVENQTVLGIEDLTIAIPKAGPVVRQLGGSVEDLAFFLTAMKEGGINASEGANALKSGLASLINPSDKAAATLANLGINIKGIVEANKGDLKATVVGFAEALDQLAPLERSRAIEQLFGKFQFARLSTLFQNVTKDGSQASRTFELTGKSMEELAILSERELGTVEDATSTKFKKSMENLKVSIAPIGEQFLKAITPIAEFVSKILDWFNGLSDGVKSGISRIVLIVGAIGPVVLMTFGLLANGLANIIKLFGLVRNGFLGLGKNSDQLAFQTQYMSTEQQEAATIAASLDQAHSKLIQTFTVEQGAVSQLAAAYQQAAAAGARLQQTNPGFFTPGARRPNLPGFATGIVSVPGPKGAGDIVPAMLSPGEAVIPTAQNEKYGPLVQGIIADNIPGFAGGRNGKGFWSKSRRSSLIDDLGLNPDERVRIPLGGEARSYSVAGVMAPKSVNSTSLGMTKDFLQSFEGRQGMSANIQVELEHIGTSAQRVQEVLNTIAQTITTAIDEWDGSMEGWVRSANKAKEEIDQFASLTEKEKAAIAKRIAPSKPSDFTITGTPILEVSKDKAKKRDERETTDYHRLRQMQILQSKGIDASAWQFAHMPGFESIKTPVTDIARPTVRGRSLTEQQYGRIDKDVSEQAIQKSKVIGENTVKGFEKGANDYGEMHSPSRRTYRQGQDLVRGMTNGIDDETKTQTKKRRRITRSGQAGGLVPGGPPNGPQPAEKADVRYIQRTGPGMFDYGYVDTKPVAGDAVDKDKQLKDAQRQRTKTMLARTNGAMFAMTSLTSVMGMMGNGVAQKAAPFMAAINGATMAMQMIQGPWSGLAVGVTALVAGIWYLHNQTVQSAKKMSDLIDATAATSDRIKEIGKITGKVGASEIEDRRRKSFISDRYTTGFNRAGQQFGTTFLESDVGKNIFKSFQESLKTNGKTALSQIGHQLAIYVSQGLMDGEQAESIARAIGVSMSDMTITSEINGQLRELIGPAGSDLLKNPLEVRVKIIGAAESIATDLANSAFTTEKVNTTGSNREGYQAPEVVQSVKADPKLLAAAAAQNVQNLETVQQQIDSQNKMYDDQIASLKLDKEKTKNKKDQLKIDNQISFLIEQRKKDEAEIRNSAKGVIAQQLDLFKRAKGITTSGGNASAVQNAIKQQVNTRFKEDPFTASFLDATKELGQGGKKELEVTINTVVGAGIATPKAMLDMIQMFGKDTKGLEQTFTALLETQDPARVGELVNIFNTFGARQGANKQVLASIMTKISSKDGQEKFDKRLAALQLLMQLNGKEINVGAMIESKDGLEKLDQITSDIEKIEQVDTPITKKVVTELGGDLGADLSPLISDWKEFGKLPEEVKKTAIQTYLSIYRTIGQPEKNQYVEKQVAGVSGVRAKERMAATASKASDAEITMGLYEPILQALGIEYKGDGAGGNKDGGKFKPTMFDDILKKLKLVQDSSINAMGGLDELKRVMLGKDAISLTKFKGVDQALLKNGKVSQEFLDFVDALGPEGLQKDLKQFIKIGKDGIATLNSAGKALMRGMGAVKLGEMTVANKNRVMEINNEINATSKLVKAGFSFAQAQEVAKDATLALLIATNQLTPKQIEALRKSTVALTKAELDYQDIEKTAMMDAMDGEKTRLEMVQKRVALQEKLIENQYLKEQTVLESRQSANNYALDLIGREEDKINEKYNAQISALEKINDLNQKNNELQNKKLSLITALTSGNVSQAASALQDFRQTRAAQTAQSQIDNLKSAQEAAIARINVNGRTRKVIEEDNKQIANSLNDIAEKIRLAKENLDKQLQETIGMTRAQIEGAVTAIGLAIDAKVDPKDEKFLGNILKGLMGDADNTSTAIKATTKNIKDLIAELDAAKAKHGATSKFGDTKAKEEADAKAAAEAAAAALAAQGKTNSSVIAEISQQAASASSQANNLADQSALAKQKIAAQTATAYLKAGLPVPKNVLNDMNPSKPSMSKSTADKLRQLGLMYNSGGMVPKYFASGGYGRGTDTIPAMLSAGEYVVKKSAVDSIGVGNMNRINQGELPASVYNYSLSVNLNGSNMNANEVARVVMQQIKQVESQRVRGI